MLSAECDDRVCSIAPGLTLDYLVWPTRCEVTLIIMDRSEDYGASELDSRRAWQNRAFGHFLENKDQIENSFGGPLDWNEAASISSYIDGGYHNAELEWASVIMRQVGAMNRLHAAILPHINALPKLEVP